MTVGEFLLHLNTTSTIKFLVNGTHINLRKLRLEYGSSIIQSISISSRFEYFDLLDMITKGEGDFNNLIINYEVPPETYRANTYIDFLIL